MNSEWRAATALLIYSATLTIAILLAMAHTKSTWVAAVIVFGVCLTIVWGVGPALLRLVSRRRH